ncbi:MAG TPA: GFA family protein [Solirubrobacteraceae bacterium]|nr:GFA family protein [Solirubrobacteraceae bacterium]
MRDPRPARRTELSGAPAGARRRVSHYRLPIADDAHALPSPESPLQGGCLCGAVRFELTAPFLFAGYCHCTHCQRRTGTGSSANGRVPQEGFRLLRGEERLRAYQPPSGVPKLFCRTCGSALFSGDPFSDPQVAVRLGALDRDPGVRPQFRQFVDSAALWEPIPEDGLERFPRSRSESLPRREHSA